MSALTQLRIEVGEATPGEWGIGYLDKNAQRVIQSESAMEICTCWHHSVGALEREMEANARHIITSDRITRFIASEGAVERVARVIGQKRFMSPHWQNYRGIAIAVLELLAGEGLNPTHQDQEP